MSEMDLGITEKVAPLLEEVRTMMQDEILPLDEEYLAEVEKGDRWAFTDRQTEILDGLKAKAQRGSSCSRQIDHPAFEGSVSDGGIFD